MKKIRNPKFKSWDEYCNSFPPKKRKNSIERLDDYGRGFRDGVRKAAEAAKLKLCGCSGSDTNCNFRTTILKLLPKRRNK